MACARLPEGGSVEGVGCGGLGGELNHLMQAGFVGLPPLRVVPLQEPRLLSAGAAGAVQGPEESGYRHLYSSYGSFRKAFGRAKSISVMRPVMTWLPTTEVQKSLPLPGRVPRTNPGHMGER